jgi:hypothetical protein
MSQNTVLSEEWNPVEKERTTDFIIPYIWEREGQARDPCATTLRHPHAVRTACSRVRRSRTIVNRAEGVAIALCVVRIVYSEKKN